ncbi:MAG: T9SS type A sorting domain-containing protein [Candidatus Kapabacteria bacterium]|nr:T9SS type A sorting domain-containing protein [Candidatus Kapabacteria bacterium]
MKSLIRFATALAFIGFSFGALTARLLAQVLFSYASTGQEYGKANTVDADNNHIVAALFQGSINVNPRGSTILTSSGQVECVVAKYSPAGALIWGIRLGGATSTDVPHGVETDAAGNVYVTGYFGSETDANPRSADFNPAGGGTLRTQSGFDAFLAKYDKNGQYLWSLALGNSAGNTEERAWDIAVDAAGNSVIAGAFSGTVNFNPLGAAQRTLSAGDNNSALFIAKYSPTGQNLWAVMADAHLTDVFTEGYATLDFAPNGELVIAGNFRQTVSFSGTPTTLSSRGQTDIFLARLNAETGALLWTKQIGGTAADVVSPGALRVNANNNIFFTGRFTGICNFNPDGTTNVSGGNLYLASYSGAGALRFAFAMNSPTTGSGGHRVGFDRTGNVYVAGWMRGATDFDPGAATATLTSLGTQDVFLAAYTNDGKYLWARNFGSVGNTQNDICAGLALDRDDNVYLTGQIYGRFTDFDPSPAREGLLANAGQNDCFVVKYDKNGNLWQETMTNVSNGELASSGITISPNPLSDIGQVHYTLSSASMVRLEVVDMLGNCVLNLVQDAQVAGVHHISLRTDNLPQGSYLLRLQAGTQRVTQVFGIVR